LHPQITQQDLDIYEQAASGLISGWEIAFDLNKTLVDTYLWHNAQTELKAHPEKYDGVGFDHFVHQSALMRIPFRGIQAMLLGLAAAGNRLSLNTSDNAEKSNLHTFFNDFPLMKVVFGLVPDEDPFRLINGEHLQRSPHVMDEIKRKGFYERYFKSPEGEIFIEEICKEAGVRRSYIEKILENGKIPLPGYTFDVLVDDLFYWVGEMQTLGFGRRWVEATGSAEAILKGLEEYFSKPLPSTSPLLQVWLQPKINPLILPAAPMTVEPGEKRGEIITMEQAHLISISGKLKSHQSYLMNLGIDQGLISRALAPNGNLTDKATLLLEALLEQFYQDNRQFPDTHPHASKLLEIVRSSKPLKKEIQGILNTLDQNHGYNLLKAPLAPFLISK
jgi:hypothetical protein